MEQEKTGLEDLILQEENIFYLSEEEYDKFVEILNNPPASNETLKKAFEKYKFNMEKDNSEST
tara:strand:- start:1218 stop:1406 length:189 start_codon:yes stop_codon:yes gene_type:complete